MDPQTPELFPAPPSNERLRPPAFRGRVHSDPLRILRALDVHPPSFELETRHRKFGRSLRGPTWLWARAELLRSGGGLCRDQGGVSPTEKKQQKQHIPGVAKGWSLVPM